MLPQSSKVPIDSPSGAVRYVTEPNARFVSPDLELSRESLLGADGPSVVLISAPAAVGKTTLAAEIAQQTGSPLWDLSRFSVGNDFFVGTLARHFGAASFGQVYANLEGGEGCVILDAVDEAQLRAGPRNFDAFLEDLAKAHVKARPRPSLVLLARPVTASLVAIALEIAGVSFRHYVVAFFDEAAAGQLIDVYLDNADQSKRHRTSRKPFEELREALFDQVFAALGLKKDWGADEARRFLGYAPVLAAIASYLSASANYQTAANAIRSAKVPKSMWAFLVGLVSTVLKREQAKTIQSLKPVLETTAKRLGFSSWDRLYSPDEQCARVLERVTGQHVEPPVPDEMPTGLAAEYEDALRDWLENHPFCQDDRQFANVVFQDYVHAHALAGGRSDLCKIVRERLASEALPSPLLGAFLLTLAPKSARTKLPVIDAVDVGSLYDSMQSFARPSDVVSLDLTMTEASGIAVGVARFPTDDNVESSRDFSFEFLTGDKPVRFGQQLSSAIIDLESDVELGYPGRVMSLGPDVLITCRRLAVVASAYRVHTQTASSDTDEGQVNLSAETLEQAAVPELKVFGEGFSVQIDDVPYPWAPHRKAPAKSAIPKERWDAFSRLRKILFHFRAHGRAEIARYAQFVDNILVGQSATGKALMEVLLKKGLLRRQGDLYVLTRERVRDLGINRTDLVESRMSRGIAALLAEVETKE